MSVDWVTTLQEQADFVNEIAKDVAQTLELPNLSDVQVSRLHRVVEQGASTFDRIMEEIDRHNVESDLVETAETIADVWTNLAVSTVNKLREMRGLDAIAFPPEDEGEEN